jgi:Pyruvate/2-oxoacid:ferredoxin oxidoreductase gamma subunit
MEREVMLTGIGGQGVQLAAQVLARAATREGRQVMLFGVYSGMMRGGNSDSTVVVGDAPLQAPPLISRTWSAVVLHHKYWSAVRDRLRPGSLVVVNTPVFEDVIDRDNLAVYDVPATATAIELGTPMTASMVATGAYVAITGLVSLDSAVAGMAEAVPPYRQQHVAANEIALRAGFDLAAAAGWLGASPAFGERALK